MTSRDNIALTTENAAGGPLDSSSCVPPANRIEPDRETGRASLCPEPVNHKEPDAMNLRLFAFIGQAVLDGLTVRRHCDMLVMVKADGNKYASVYAEKMVTLEFAASIGNPSSWFKFVIPEMDKMLQDRLRDRTEAAIGRRAQPKLITEAKPCK
jgi:hypothetical protein